jgi:hypothetical protein
MPLGGHLMNIRHTSARALLGAVTLTLALGASLGAAGSAEAASGLPGQKAGLASHSTTTSARAKVTKTGIPQRVSRAGLPG